MLTTFAGLRPHTRPEVRRTGPVTGLATPPARVCGRDGLAADPRRAPGAAATAGLTDTELSRLSSPVGLDLRARTPEETAVSIAAEIIAARSGGSGARLRDLDQPIHQRAGQAISLSTCLL
jgi:hypothetical protein